MRSRVMIVLLVAGVVAACAGGAASPAASAIAPSMSMPGPTSPTLAPAPTPSPTPAIAIVPLSTGSPDRAGAVGLDWTRAHTDRAVWGSIIEHGPGGWVHLLVTDGEIPSTPRLMLSAELEAWADVTPAGDVVACGDGGSLAASASVWLLRCGGLWRSADGRTWESVAGSTDDGTPITDLRTVVSDGRAFVATEGTYPGHRPLWHHRSHPRTDEPRAMSARTYFVGNRIWWAAALFLAPITAAIVGSPVAGVVAAAILVLPAFVLFDTDRSWWSGEVRTVLQNKERSQTELRLLTAFAGIGLAVGVVLAFLIG